MRAQQPWDVDRCMRYAAVHAHEVKLAGHDLADSRVAKTTAIGAFLPEVDAQVGTQYNFGRAINPETNTYTNVSTFYNSYGLSASIPVFDGLKRYHDLRLARANLLMGRSALRARQDEVALRVYKAFVAVCYYHGTLRIAREKLAESTLMVRQTRAMADVGTKGEADVAQMEATRADDDYELTRQQSLLANAMLTLKAEMNFPADSALTIDTLCASPQLPVPTTYMADVAEQASARVLQARYALAGAKQALASAKSGLMPTIYIGAGISTTYYKTLGSPTAESFGRQLSNNMGQYVYATLSIPLFSRLTTVGNIRRQRINLQRAADNLEHERTELRRMVAEAATDLDNSRAELLKMQRKVEADSIAAHVARRRYEEGLASPIDVKTTAVALLQSRVQLLQSALEATYKQRILNFYNGQPLWTDQ